MRRAVSLLVLGTIAVACRPKDVPQERDSAIPANIPQATPEQGRFRCSLCTNYMYVTGKGKAFYYFGNGCKLCEHNWQRLSPDHPEYTAALEKVQSTGAWKTHTERHE